MVGATAQEQVIALPSSRYIWVARHAPGSEGDRHRKRGVAFFRSQAAAAGAYVDSPKLPHGVHHAGASLPFLSLANVTLHSVSGY